MPPGCESYLLTHHSHGYYRTWAAALDDYETATDAWLQAITTASGREWRRGRGGATSSRGCYQVSQGEERGCTASSSLATVAVALPSSSSV